MVNSSPSVHQAANASEEANRYLRLNGKSYDLAKWVTPAKYAKLFELSSPNVVTNWIARGVIPAENVIEVPELNGVKLIKAISYRDKVSA